MSKITIIGAGKMGTALAKGLLRQNYSPSEIMLSSPDLQTLQILAKDLQLKFEVDNPKAIASANIILLAVKPHQIKKVAEEIAPFIQEKKPLIISIAAGIKLQNLQTYLGNSIPVIRAMPNTPALINAGITALCCNTFVTPSQHHAASKIFESVGETVWLDDESLLNPITAISGCGPAYVFLFMELLENAARQVGIPEKLAKSLVLQTTYGAAKLALHAEKDFVELREQVTSPQGSTAEAIKVFLAENTQTIFENAIKAATQRAQELGELNK